MKTENERYFRLSLKGNNGLLSIHESKKLNSNEYHKIENTESGVYQVLTATTKKTGRNFYSLNVRSEPYQTYEFQHIMYPIINDFELDGFHYDAENKVVVYGSIYGIYALRDGKEYYDVISGEKISWAMLEKSVEIEYPENFQEMIEDLEIIQNHKEAYLNITRERIAKLSEGAKNMKIANKKYLENYDRKKQAEDAKFLERMQRSMEACEKLREAAKPKKEKVKKMIYEIKNNN